MIMTSPIIPCRGHASLVPASCVAVRGCRLAAARVGWAWAAARARRPWSPPSPHRPSTTPGAAGAAAQPVNQIGTSASAAGTQWQAVSRVQPLTMTASMAPATAEPTAITATAEGVRGVPPPTRPSGDTGPEGPGTDSGEECGE